MDEEALRREVRRLEDKVRQRDAQKRALLAALDRRAMLREKRERQNKRRQQGGGDLRGD